MISSKSYPLKPDYLSQRNYVIYAFLGKKGKKISCGKDEYWTAIYERNINKVHFLDSLTFPSKFNQDFQFIFCFLQKG